MSQVARGKRKKRDLTVLYLSSRQNCKYLPGNFRFYFVILAAHCKSATGESARTRILFLTVRRWRLKWKDAGSKRCDHTRGEGGNGDGGNGRKDAHLARVKERVHWSVFSLSHLYTSVLLSFFPAASLFLSLFVSLPSHLFFRFGEGFLYM